MTADHGPANPDVRPPPVRSSDFGLPVVNLARVIPELEALELVPRDFAERHHLLPLLRTEHGLRIAISDPLDAEGIDVLAGRLALVIEPVLALRTEIDAAIVRHYDRAGTEESRPSAVEEPPADVPVVGDGPVISQVRAIIDEALARRASDIHVEPLAERLRIRYRIDGVLQEGPATPRARQAEILSRLKLMANLSIAERRLPQDGRMRHEGAGRLADLRVASMPTVHGESIVLRILDQAALRRGLPELGFLPDDEAAFERLLALPDGLVLVTGPTGSGKTTTLYSCLDRLNRPDRKIITVEDPVEYRLPGINQVAVRPEVGMTFATALRAMLRQSPNTIMVGEIRDRETAETALQAALTGHLVFSTLHTNDAPGAVARLIELGVRPHLLAAVLRAAVAQRLVRRICPQCRESRPPDAAGRELLARYPEHATGGDWSAGTGCETCGGTGYHGRIGLFEVLAVGDDTRELISARTGPTRLRGHARALGIRTMREDGVRKAARGLTTLDEVIAATVDAPN